MDKPKHSQILTDDLEKLCLKDVTQHRALESIASLDGVDSKTLQEIARQALEGIEKLMKPKRG